MKYFVESYSLNWPISLWEFRTQENVTDATVELCCVKPHALPSYKGDWEMFSKILCNLLGGIHSFFHYRES